MNVTSYATSESYQNGVELKRSEFERTERCGGSFRLPSALTFDSGTATDWMELSSA